MTTPTVLVSTWEDGLFVMDGETRSHEPDGQPIAALACDGPFAEQGAVYRRPIAGHGPLTIIGGGLPRWTRCKVDTRCLNACGSVVTLADWKGSLYLSVDSGRAWSRLAEGLPFPSSVLVV